MKKISKQKTSSLNPAPTQMMNKNVFEQEPFTVPTHQAPVTDPNIDLSEYRQPQPGETIANVMRSIEAGTANKPAFTRRDNELTAPPRQNYQPIINPIRQLTAPRPDSNGKGQIVQTKLTIGRPNDKYEQEADRVATQVVRQINRPAPMSMVQGGMVQGKEEESGLRMKPMPAISELEAMSEEGELQMKPMLQSREAIGGGEASRSLSGEINSARGGGQPLDLGLQQSIGQAMGADFSGVRVHTDERADRLNQSLSARAFTTGQDLFFKKGEYQPGSREGQGLIAHELTHVEQQRGMQEGTVQCGKKRRTKRNLLRRYESEGGIIQRVVLLTDHQDQTLLESANYSLYRPHLVDRARTHSELAEAYKTWEEQKKDIEQHELHNFQGYKFDAEEWDESEEPIIIIGHGSKPDWKSHGKFQGKTGKAIADQIELMRLPNSYKGVIYFNGCHTAEQKKTWSGWSESFINKFVEKMREKEYKMLSAKGNINVAITETKTENTMGRRLGETMKVGDPAKRYMTLRGVPRETQQMFEARYEGRLINLTFAEEDLYRKWKNLKEGREPVLWSTS